MIEIQDIQRMSKSQIVDLILDRYSNVLEIFIPKYTVLYSSETKELAIDYNKLAYAGHLLKSASTSFEYEEIEPGSHDSVLFKIQFQDMEKLASKLLEISFGYINDEEEDIYQDIEEDFEFDMNADHYLSDVAEGKIKDVACPYFCQIALQYFNEITEEEE